MLNIFKKFLRDGLQNSRNTGRRFSQRRRNLPKRQQAAAVEALEAKTLLTATDTLVNYLTTEHVDINIGRSGSGWSIGPQNSDVFPATQYDNDEVVLYAGAPSESQRPGSSDFDFIGVGAGETYYLLPQNQNVDVLYLGFAAYGLDSSVDQYNPSTESKGRASGNARWAKVSLAEVRHSNPDGSTGTGEFSMWQNGTGGPVSYISTYDDGVANPNGDGLDTTDGISADDAMWILAGGHSHFNFGFTQPGRYEVDVKLSATFGGSFQESNNLTIYFSVMSAGELEFDSSTYSVDEGAGTATIDVVRTGGSDGRLLVDYSTSDGTATAASDYTEASGTLEFLDGETSKTITIPILEDTLAENDETINLTLSVDPFDDGNPLADHSQLNDYVMYAGHGALEDPNGYLGVVDSAVLTIMDNDIPPTISNVTDKTTPEDTATSAIPFTVGDNSTPAALLSVTATSSNPTLVPNGNIVLGGSGANRTITITPAANLFGVTTITLTVTDSDGLTATDTFNLTVTSDNDPPTITDVVDQSIQQDTATGTIPFTVGDVETAAAALTVTATSSNTTLVPNGNIVLGGSGANRSVTVTPAAGQMGNATITLTVTDGDGGTATDTFVLNVGPPNTPPTITDIGNQLTDVDVATGSIPFTVGDSTTAAAALVVTASSSNMTLVPNGNITLGGSGANRTISLTPAADQVGTTTITVTVTDEGGLQTSDTFDLRVVGNGLVPFSLSQPAATDLNLSYQVAAADLTGDGLDDLLIVTTSDRDITYAPSLGDGNFGDLQVIEPGAASFVSDAYPLDVDNDGDLDVLAVGTDMLQYYLNDGLGNFSSPVTVASEGAFFAAVANDLDGDGDTDFAVTDRTDGSVYLYRNSGDGSFAREVVGSGFDGLRGLVSLDADGDGDIDLIASADRVNKVSLFVNDGTGNFASEVVLTTDVEGIRYLYSGDIDGDGNVDFVSTAFSSSELAWYESGGDGTFEKHVVAADDTGIFVGAIGDIDGDGDLDLVSGGFSDSSVSWYANDGAGNFTDRQVISAIPGGGILSVAAGDFDGDGNIDAAAAGTPIRSISSVFLNLSGRFSNQVVAPEDGIYFEGEAITFDVHFGIPVDVTGTPEVELQVGDRTVSAEYISGSGTPTLRFRYFVDAADRDLDGISFASAAVVLPSGAAMTGPTDADVDRTLPATDMSGVLVNGSAPRVASITRLDPAETPQSSVRFVVTFNEPVTGVTADKFAAQAYDGISGAVVTGVTGDGSEYIVTVDTGSGSGVLGLTNGADGIVDTEGNGLATPILGGEVYTLRRRAARTIDNYFTEGHADIGILYGDNRWNFQAPGSDLNVDEVLIVGGPDSQAVAPAGSEFDFLGATAGIDIYILPQTDVPATLPDLGISSTASPSDAFAEYANTDPRVDAAAEWLELQLVGMRGPDGGEFSLYSSGLTEPTVWMATSDGIDDSDSLLTPSGSHGHYNWAFTQPGGYEIDVFASGFLDANGNGTFDEGIDPYSESGITTLYFSIDPPGGPQPYAIDADLVPANVLVPFALPEYHGGEFSDGSYGQVTGDFNDDGHVDLIVAGNGENALTYMQGNGDGTFQPEQLLNAESGVRSQGVTGVDYDGDGDTDVLVYEFNDATQSEGANEGTITLYRNDGDANFTREVVFDGLIVGYWIDAGDLNGDGRADVVYGANRYDFETRVSTIEKAVLLQQTDGTLGEKTVLTDEYSGDLIMEDVDGDGHLDIVSTGNVYDSSTFTSTPYLQIFAGNGDGTFDAPQDVSSNAAPNIHQVIDLNGDGLKDLLVYDRGADSHVGYYPQQADGSFGERVTLTPGYLYSQVNVAADINGDGLPDIVSYGYSGGYKVVWSPNLGGGAFGDSILLSSNVSNGGLHIADVDNDTYPDIINAGNVTATRPTPISVFINKTGEDPMVLVPPAARTRIGGDPIDLQVYFGFLIEVTGTPRIALQVGENTVYAEYVSGSGTPFLDFRYTVAETDIDLDGVQLASNLIDLNGGTLTDPIGGEAVLEFPNLTFDGVIVNAVGPLVEMVSRVDSTPTDAEAVRFTVQFSEDVTDVDVSDFSVRMTEGDLAGATVDSVTAISASEYEVTVSTGTGSGALGLSVNDSASINDLESHGIARGYEGGEVYTVRQQPIGDIDTYYTNGHADYRPVYEDGEFTYIINPDDSLLPEPTYPSNEVITYLDSTAVVARGDGENYDFLGVAAGEPIYISDSSGSVASVPYLGWEGGSLPRDVFADYRPTSDPRVTSSSMREYVKVQMVDFRSSSDGDFAMYGGSTPTVWMATSDGITISDDDTSDAFWLYPGTHLHRNVAFTKPGTYEIDVVVSGYLDNNASDSLDDTDVYVESGIHTLVFHVDTLGARNDVFLVVDNNTVNGDVTANDDWHEGIGEFVATVETEPEHGTLNLQEDGTFSYEPSDTFDGTDTFAYRLANPRGGFTIGMVALTGSHSPIAFDDSYSTREDETLTIGGAGVLTNDVDADGDPLKTALVSAPQNGSLTLNPDGSFTYVPDAHFNGTDSFTYTTTDVRYEVTALGTLGGNTSFALDVNNLNQVTGNSGIVEGSNNPLHAFRWTDGSLEDLGVVEGTGDNNFSRGYAINDAGVVVGESDNSASKAFRFENGMIANLGTLGGTSAVASDINNLDQIVGSSSNGTASKPFVYVDGAMLELPTIAGNAESTGRAWGISPDGRFIVGLSRADDAEFLSHATMWERQTDGSYSVVDMGALMDEHNYSYAYAVNDDGTAVGASVVGTVSPTSSTSLYHGFVYHDGEMHDVGILSYHSSYVHSEVKDINATNQFVGSVSWFYNFPSFGAAAVLGEVVDGGTAMIDLAHLVNEGSDWTFQSAEGINDGRSIVGYGRFDGATQAFLLTPVTADDDNNVFGNVATVTIDVAAQSDAPIAADDAYAVGSGNSVRGNVLFNDFEPDGDSMVAELGETVQNGTLDFSPDGRFTYTPGETFDGTDLFTYTVSDGTSATEATVTITAADSPQGEVLHEGHADFLINYHGDHWDFSILGDHDHGHDEDDDDEHGEDDDHDHDDDEEHEHDHDHDHDHGHGEDDHLEGFHLDEVIVHGGPDAALERPADVAFDFTGVGAGETFFVLPQSQLVEVPFLGINGEEVEADTFVDNQFSLHLLAVDGPGEFSLWQSGLEGPDIFFASHEGITAADAVSVREGAHAHYNWGFSAAGTYRVTLMASGILQDGMEAVSSEAVTLTFMIGDVSIAVEDEFSVTEGNSVQGNVLTNDIIADGAAAVVSEAVAPEHGTLLLNDDETFTYTPDETFDGEDSFSYMLSDGTSETIATVEISLIENGTVEVRKFHDLNGDGQRTSDELWLNGWTIRLLDDHGQVVAETVTADVDLNNDQAIDSETESGWAVFDVAPGNYTIEEVSQDGWIQTSPVSSATSTAYALDRTNNFSLTLSDFENWGGLGERWIFSSNGWFYITPDGSLFEWDGSSANDLSGTQVATLTPAYHDNLSLLVDIADPTGFEVMVVSNETNDVVYFGNQDTSVPGSISVRKFNDLNGDGQRSSDEPWLNGWTIRLLDANGQVIAETVTTDVDLNNDQEIDPETESGWAVFDVAPGTYTVEEVAQDGWEQTTPVSAATSAAYDLDRANNFSLTLSDFENWGGLGERWIFSSNGWFYVTPDGSLFKWNGSSADNLTGTQVATLTPAYHDDLSLLVNVADPSGGKTLVMPNQATDVQYFGGHATSGLNSAAAGVFASRASSDELFDDVESEALLDELMQELALAGLEDLDEN